MIAYLFFRFAEGIFRLIPMWMLYRISDVLSFILHRIFTYRKTVILKNLSQSFPQKTEQELQKILKQSYQNLSDIMLEGLKGLTLNQDALIRRYQFINPEVVSDFFEKGQSVIGLVAHYNNWEWGALATAPQIRGKVVGVSKAVHNPYIDRYLKKNRARFQATIIHMNETLRAIINLRSTPSLFVLIADQSPSNARNAHWLNFLNQETACLTGPDKIARKTNYPVIYFDVQRVERGYYEITAKILTQNPKNTHPEEITHMYMKELETIIREQPENWLWSHKRWKKKKIIKHSSKE